MDSRTDVAKSFVSINTAKEERERSKQERDQLAVFLQLKNDVFKKNQQHKTAKKELEDDPDDVDKNEAEKHFQTTVNFLRQKYEKMKKQVGYVGKNIGQQYCWCSLMWLMPLRSLSNCDYELNFYLRLILGPIHSNQVTGTDPVGSYHGTRNSRSNSVNPTYQYQSHD